MHNSALTQEAVFPAPGEGEVRFRAYNLYNTSIGTPHTPLRVSFRFNCFLVTVADTLL